MSNSYNYLCTTLYMSIFNYFFFGLSEQIRWVISHLQECFRFMWWSKGNTAYLSSWNRLVLSPVLSVRSTEFIFIENQSTWLQVTYLFWCILVGWLHLMSLNWQEALQCFSKYVCLKIYLVKLNNSTYVHEKLISIFADFQVKGRVALV